MVGLEPELDTAYYDDTNFDNLEQMVIDNPALVGQSPLTSGVSGISPDVPANTLYPNSAVREIHEILCKLRTQKRTA